MGKLFEYHNLNTNDVTDNQIWTLVLIEKTPPAFYLEKNYVFPYVIKLQYTIMLFIQSFLEW